MAYDYERDVKTRSASAEIDMGLKAYMNKVYSFMAVGLGLTGVIAHLTSTMAFDFKTNTMTAFGNLIYGSPLAFIIMLAPLGFIIALNMGISKMKESTVQILFWAFAAVMGLSLSSIFIQYTGESVARVFFISAGAFGALVLSYFYKTLKWKNFKESVFLTAKTTAMIMWLFIGSWTFSSVFSYLGGHEVFEHFFKSIDIAPWQFLVITQIIIFLLGWPLEWTEILIIFVPIFLPLLEVFGVDPYFFAMLIALNLQTSFLTPPMAMSAYYLKGVQPKNVELLQIFAGIMPFLAIVILAMVLMYLFPGIALWLPNTLFAS